MNIAVRVDASTRMGTGHLVRCRTLSEHLRGRGAAVRFICREHPGHLIDALRADAFPVTVLPSPTASSVDSKAAGEDYAEWLGVSQAQDAAETLTTLDGWRPDWLVVDHYGLDADWETALRPHVGRILVIDDLANRRHDCDLLLDQNYAIDTAERYRGLVPPQTRLLLGPRYALLHPVYAQYRQTPRRHDGSVGRVLVFFGGTDPHNLTGLALEALSTPALADLAVDVVVGANNPYRKLLAEKSAARPGTEIYGPRPHLADLMAVADLGLGAGGATSWERCCVGLPSIVVSIARNQRPACEALAGAGLIRYLGGFEDVDAARFQDALRRLCGRPDEARALSDAGRSLVDGLGAERLAEALHPTPDDCLRLRPARPEDAAHYFNWVNDPTVREQSLHRAPITWANHAAWFAARLADPDANLFLLEAQGLPVGQVRFEREGDEARIAYSLDPLVRGRGWGNALIRKGIAALRVARPITLRAEVKAANVPSCAVFLRLGFEEEAHAAPSDRIKGGVRVFRRALSQPPRLAE